MSRSTLKRWRSSMPETLWQAGPGGARLYHVEAVREWRSGQRGPGRPAELDRLLAGESDGSQGATATAAGGKSGRPRGTSAGGEPSAAAEAGLTDEDRAALSELLAAQDLGELLGLADSLPVGRVKKIGAFARLRRELADAAKRERQNREADGELVLLVEVKRAWAAQVGVVQARFRMMPGALAQRLVGRSYEEMHDLLEEELRSTLRAFAVEELAVAGGA